MAVATHGRADPPCIHIPPPSVYVPIDNDVKMPDKKDEVKGGWAMRKMVVFLLAAFVFGSAAHSAQTKEYAIIKDTMFGTQKIEIYQTLKDALENYTGEGKLYEISRKEVLVKRVESKKKVEMTEYKWIVEDKGKTDTINKTEKTDKPVAPVKK
jgi:hypothetical protein